MKSKKQQQSDKADLCKRQYPKFLKRILMGSLYILFIGICSLVFLFVAMYLL